MDLEIDKTRAALQQIRNLLETVIPAPRPLADAPLEIWLMRPVPLWVVADLWGLSPAQVKRKFRDKVLQLDGKDQAIRLCDALQLKSDRGAP
jgi:hypothetical protein